MVLSYTKKWWDRQGRRLMSILLVLIMTLSLLPGAALAQEVEDETYTEIESIEPYSSLLEEEPFDGLSYREQNAQTSDGQNVNTFVITMDGSDNHLQVVAGVPNDATSLTPGLTQTTSGQAAAAQRSGKNVLAAVNADFFYINDSTKIQPAGVTIKDGVELSPYSEDEGNRSYFFGVKEDGTPVIGDKEIYDTVESDLEQAVGGGPWLVKEGEVQNVTDERHPRTAVGITEDGSILLVVADGRTSASAGFTFQELAQYMKDLGAVEALNLDGGGSSAAVVKNPGTYALEVKNRPSDGTERPVGNTLLVIDTDNTSIDVDLTQDTDGYYLIEEANDFAQINKLPSGNYRLNGDIDAMETEIPIVSALSGNFDGGDHTIFNLSVESGSGYALFGTLMSGGSIHNLSMKNVDITSGSSAAALVGSCAGTVEYVTVTGSLSGTRKVGGIIASLDNGGKLLHSAAGVSVTGSERIGGLVGEATDNTLIDSCYVSAQVLGGNMAAGVVGRAVSDKTQNANIRNCIVTGSVQGAIEPGGIGGLLKIGVANCIVRDMHITATSTEGTSSGNVTGLIGAWINGTQPYTGNVIQSGSIIATSQCTAHRIGYQDTNKTNNYVNPAVTINGQPETGGLHNNNIGADATQEELGSQEFYAGLGFDFDTVFVWDSETNSPVLIGVDQTVMAPEAGSSNALEQDTEGYYLIKTAADLGEISKAPLEKYRLADDLNLTGVKVDSIITFGGVFDGNGKTISNLSAAPESGSWALFSTLLAGGRIHDLTLRDVNIRASADYTAALVGACAGTVEDVTVTGKIYGRGITGTVVASLSNGGIIRRCAVGAMVVGTGNQVGGMAGFNDGIIEACYANVTVQGVNNVGGIAGFSDKNDATRAVRNCIAEGSVTATGIEAGGIGGLLKMLTTNNIVKNMTAIATNTTTAAGSGNVAGLLGGWMKYQPNASGNVILSGTVETAGVGEGYRLCYNAGQGTFADNYVNPAVTVNGQAVTGGTAADGQGVDLSAEQMVSKDFYAGLGFDFETVFDWDDVEKTPVLRNVDQSVTAPESGLVPGSADVCHVALNIGGDETQRNLTWYTESTAAGEVQLAPASASSGGIFPDQYTSFASTSTAASLAGYYSNQSTVTGLTANTEYVYRVGNSEGWSETYSFNTGSFENFSFLLAGDPQIGSSGNVGNDTTGWETSLNKAINWFGDVSFLLSAGDQVEKADNETQYAGFLQPESLRSMTLATNIGNHDSKSINYQEHFNLPNEATAQDDTPAGGDYWYSYNGVLFMSINSNNLSTAQHKAFLKEAIQAYKDANNGGEPEWKIVTFHHSIYSTASHTDDTDILQRRGELSVVLSNLGIDAVLMGHDHVYTRSFMMSGTQPTTNVVTDSVTDPAYGQVLYLTANSASGSKFYAIKSELDFPFMAKQNQESVPNLTKVDVSGDAITFTTYRTGVQNTIDDVVDTFSIRRTQAKPENPVTSTTLVSTEYTQWKYLDNNTDPGTADEPKCWTAVDYDDTAWSEAKGSFGAKKGGISSGAHDGYTPNTLLQQYQDDANKVNTPAFFFRFAFDLDDVDKITALNGTLYYDDGVIVYINGIRVAGFNDEKMQGNMSYNNSTSSNNATLGSFTLGAGELQALNLKETGNILAVELHNADATSSDVYFDFASLQAVIDTSPDTMAPLLSVPGETTIAKGDSFDPMEGVSASDLRDGNITANVQVAGSVETTKAGTYILTYSVTDRSGNTATAKRTVMVKDMQTLITTAQTQWKYRDDNVDPASGNAERTIWTRAGYDDSDGAWKSAKGSFGAKGGAISDIGGGCIPNTLLTQYIPEGQENTGKDVPGFFFRTTITLSDISKVDALHGTVCYDDGLIVYINGIRVAAFHDRACDESGTYLGHGFTENLQYGGSNDSDPKTVSFTITGDELKAIGLHEGENTVAVELHNGRATSSDVYFDFLSLTAEMKADTTEGGGSGGSGSSGSGSSGSGSTGTTTPKERFTDVSSSHWAYKAVEFVAEEGLFQGTGADRFSPDMAMTRSMATTVIYRMAGQPKTGTSNFTDVSADAWYADGVTWGNENGVVMGIGSGYFLPDNSVTRQELAAMLYRYAAATGEDVSKTSTLDRFSDSASVPEWAFEALSWAVGNGIMSGKPDGTLDSGSTATRAQVASMFQRFMDYCK